MSMVGHCMMSTNGPYAAAARICQQPSAVRSRSLCIHSILYILYQRWYILCDLRGWPWCG